MNTMRKTSTPKLAAQRKSAVLHTRVEPKIRTALEEYRRRLPVPVTESAVLGSALKRFLLQAGVLPEDEELGPLEIAALRRATARKDAYTRRAGRRRR